MNKKMRTVAGTIAASSVFGVLMPALAQAPNSESQLVSDIAKDGMAEVSLGILAEKKASNKDVKAFATLMVHDHSLANDELKAAAIKDQIAFPFQLSEKQRQEGTELRNCTGAEFDRKYMAKMVAGHIRAIAAVRQESEIGRGNSKAWAQKTLPVIEEHKKEAESLNAKLNM